MRLEAELESTPTPDITWFRNGISVKESIDNIITAEPQHPGKYEIRTIKPKG